MSSGVRHRRPHTHHAGCATAATCLATMASLVMLSMGATKPGRFGSARVVDAGAIHAAPPTVSHEPARSAATASQDGASPSTRTHPLVLAADLVGVTLTRAVSLSRMGSLYGP